MFLCNYIPPAWKTNERLGPLLNRETTGLITGHAEKNKMFNAIIALVFTININIWLTYLAAATRWVRSHARVEKEQVRDHFDKLDAFTFSQPDEIHLRVLRKLAEVSSGLPVNIFVNL